MTAFNSKQLAAPPAANNNCNHPRLSLGLDSAYCPDCKSNFGPRTQEYQNAFQPPPPVTSAAEYKVGDCVSLLREPPQMLYQIVKLADDGHATVESLVRGPGCDRRRVAIWKLRPSCALPDPDCSKGREHLLNSATHEHSCSCVPPKSPTHEHSWVQKYWVRRGNIKHQYFRFCYQLDPANIGSCVRVHIPGGNVRSQRAQENVASIETALASGQSPDQIIQLIKSWKNLKEKP